MLFGCDPRNGVEADTEFIRVFFEHLETSFDSKSGSLLFPNCLNIIEQEDVKFESVTNNLGRTLLLQRQTNLIVNKVLVAITDEALIFKDYKSFSEENSDTGSAMRIAIKRFVEFFQYKPEEILILNKEEANQLF